jgi:alpha-1,6-mannosyltransferase
MRERIRRALAVLSLAGLLSTSFLLVAAAASYPTVFVPASLGGFPGWLRGPLSGLIDVFFFPADFGIAVLVMTACYLIALGCAGTLHPRWVIATVVALHVIFFLSPPLVSSDVFGYIDWARMAVLHGLNPYSTDSGTVVSDPVYPYVRWPILPSPYGPLSTLASYALVPLGVPASLWAFKLTVTASSLGCVALIWRIAGALKRSPRAGVAMYGLSPAVLVYTVGGFHNDVIMMLAVLAAVHLVTTGRERQAGAVGVVAVAIKSTAALVMPFMVLGSRDRRQILLGAAIAVGVVMVAAVLAFGGQAVDFLNVLGTQQRLTSGASVPGQLGALFGWNGTPTPVRVVALTLAGGAILWLLVRAWRGSDWIDCAGWATLAVLATSSWLLPWYIAWLLPLASLSRSVGLRVAAIAMSLFVILIRVVPTLG